MTKLCCVILIMVALAIVHASRARNVPKDPTLSDQKNFILGGFAGNGAGGDPTNSGMGVFGGFDTGPGGLGGGFGGAGGSGMFPSVDGSGGPTGDGHDFGSFPLP